MLENIENNSILIIPKSKKNKIIKETNKSLLNIKIMTINELIKKYTFDYDEKTIYYLMKKENIKYEIAQNYIKNIYYIENKDCNNKKLNKLVEIKNCLENNKLLIKDELFKEYLKEKNIYIYDDNINKYGKKILEQIKETSKIINIEEKYNNYTPQLYEFKTQTEEITFVAHKICELISNGININKIKLVNITKEYTNEIKRIFTYYNIPININKKNIYGTKIVKDFIENYEEDINKTLKIIKEKYNSKEESIKIYNKIIEIINKYIWCENYIDVKELIINDLKNTSIEKKQTNSIEITELENIEDEYTFILNFNQGIIPKIFKDEDYIDDINKEKLKIETSIEKNINEKQKTIKNIKNIKNCIITYKLKTPFQTFYPSSLIEELNIEKNINEKNNTSYSEINDKINLTKKLDNLLKFGIKDSELETLYSNYEIPYKTYDNNYTNINKNNLIKYINNNLTLSYSSMDNYYKCSFKYYINNILKLNPFEETFNTKIGTLFHYVLEHTLKNKDDYKKYWDEKIKTLELTSKEKFFINNLEETCKFTIETIKKQQQYSSLNNIKYEEKIYINKNGNIKITFMGIIDKLLYKENEDETIVAIIDYKTGNTSIDLNKTIYGLSMQLPIYLYLSKKLELKNIKIAGIYIQNIINKNDENKEENLKLNGYSTSNKNILKEFDNSYESSNIIKSMKTKKDGEFYSYAKTLNEEQIDSLTTLVDEKIEEASKNILEANFKINPKQIGYNNLIGCEFCTFKDICFKEEKNIINLKEQNYEDFLKKEEEI